GNFSSRIGFIDGVRRIDVRLFAEDSSGIAPALAGSYAVGVAWADRPPAIGPIRVGRCLVVGGGLSHVGLRANIDGTQLTYRFTSVTGSDPGDPIQALQNAMRLAESDLANEILTTNSANLVVLDGPLTYFGPEGLVVGMIKRQTKPYLTADQAGILQHLDV